MFQFYNTETKSEGKWYGGGLQEIAGVDGGEKRFAQKCLLVLLASYEPQSTKNKRQNCDQSHQHF
jgi:hypothetical protein